jgi:nicotinamidase-related amidase
MPLTTLDPNSALLLVDLQKGIVALPLAHPAAGVVRNARRLAETFRARHLPVVLVNVDAGAKGRTERPPRSFPTPEGWTDIVPELAPHAEDLRVTKKSWGAFATTDLEQRLKGLGVTQVVLAGIATATGVEATARQAFEGGFNVALALDAMTDPSAEAHQYSVDNVFPRLGETGTTDEIMALLGSPADHP